MEERRKDCSFFQSMPRGVHGDSLSPFLLSVQHKHQWCCKPNEIQVHLSLSAGICITAQSLGFCRQRTSSPFFEAFPAFLRTGECSLCQRKVLGMTFIRMIKRQSLFSLFQLAHHHWWSNKHFLISCLSLLSFPPVTHSPGSPSPKSLFHPCQIPPSKCEDVLCDVVGETPSLLGWRWKWTHPFHSTGGWHSDPGSSMGEEHHLNSFSQWCPIRWWAPPQHLTICRDIGEG